LAGMKMGDLSPLPATCIAVTTFHHSGCRRKTTEARREMEREFPG
jgi:hypothetical protein